MYINPIGVKTFNLNKKRDRSTSMLHNHSSFRGRIDCGTVARAEKALQVAVKGATPPSSKVYEEMLGYLKEILALSTNNTILVKNYTKEAVIADSAATASKIVLGAEREQEKLRSLIGSGVRSNGIVNYEDGRILVAQGASVGYSKSFVLFGKDGKIIKWIGLHEDAFDDTLTRITVQGEGIPKITYSNLTTTPKLVIAKRIDATSLASLKLVFEPDKKGIYCANFAQSL